MSLLVKNSTTAERMRGLIFSELFSSSADIMKNDATIGGAPVFGTNKVTFNGTTDYLQYKMGNNCIQGSLPWSLIVRFKPTKLGSNQIICSVGTGNAAQCFNVWIWGADNTIYAQSSYGVAGVSTGIVIDTISSYEFAMTFPGGVSQARTYVNGVYKATIGATTPAIVTPNIFIGSVNTIPTTPFQGDVSLVKVFSQQLSDEEVAQHYNNLLYSYRNRATIYLPMRNSEHTATQTLDVSGNKRHTTFGAAATCPTKLTGRHGYDFDGGDYMTVPVTNVLNVPELTIAIQFEADYAYNDGLNRFLWDSTNGTRCYCYKDATGVFRLTPPGAAPFVFWLASTTATHWRQSARMTIIVSFKSGKNNAWFNGVQVVTNEGTTWTATNTTTLNIGSSYDGLNNHDGRITRFASFPVALNQTQVFDLLNSWANTESEV